MKIEYKCRYYASDSLVNWIKNIMQQAKLDSKER